MRFILGLLILYSLTACNPTSQDDATDVGNTVESVTAVQEVTPSSDEMVTEAVQETADMQDEMVTEAVQETADMHDEMVTEAVQDTTDMPDEMAETPVSDAAQDSQDVAYAGPSWANYELTNAATGETFVLADFAGKTVFIEPMATWCSNCRSQQGRVAEAMQTLGTDDFVFISLSVGENISDATLADYAVRYDFPQIFVVGDAEFVSQLIDEFGFSVSTPPSTPHVVIAPNGELEELSTGQKSVDALITQLRDVHNS